MLETAQLHPVRLLAAAGPRPSPGVGCSQAVTWPELARHAGHVRCLLCPKASGPAQRRRVRGHKGVTVGLWLVGLIFRDHCHLLTLR